MQKGWYIK